MNRRQGHDRSEAVRVPSGLGPASRDSLDGAADYHHQALEVLDSLLAGPLGGGLGAGELQVHFPLIRAALRQVRSDLERAWPAGAEG